MTNGVTAQVLILVDAEGSGGGGSLRCPVTQGQSGLPIAAQPRPLYRSFFHYLALPRSSSFIPTAAPRRAIGLNTRPRILL
jgi:hypothetical protein